MTPVWFEIASYAILLLILAGDLVYVYRRPHIPSNREATGWIAFYVGLAVVFGLALLLLAGVEPATQFYAGWLTEYSLSIDNLFVFLLIMARFKVPRANQQEILMVGIILALVFRGVFILLGAQLVASFSWVFYIFGAFLVYTAFRQAFGHQDEDQGENALIRTLRRRIPITDEFDGAKLRVQHEGGTVFTPVIIVFIALGSTDLVFALDSIPAIFGVTRDPFLVFTANVFALMGLRQLYFLLGDLVERLPFLKYGIAFVLAFIGVKLVLTAVHENELPFINGGEPLEQVPEISTGVSLLVIVAAMTVAVVASLVAIRRRGERVVPRDDAAR
jgi:tellurite resistance protein TerC